MPSGPPRGLRRRQDRRGGRALHACRRASTRRRKWSWLSRRRSTPGGRVGGDVTWLERGPDRLRLDVSAERPALLVVADNWYPAWKARVNGESVPVLRAYHTLRAVPVPVGRSQVEMYYESRLLGWSSGGNRGAARPARGHGVRFGARARRGVPRRSPRGGPPDVRCSTARPPAAAPRPPGLGNRPSSSSRVTSPPDSPGRRARRVLRRHRRQSPGGPPTFVAATGNSHAIASRAATEVASMREGEDGELARGQQPRHLGVRSGPEETHPVRNTEFARPAPRAGPVPGRRPR